MVTLLASLAGFVTSLLPHVLKLLSDKSDRLHELNMLEKKLEASRQGRLEILEEQRQHSRDEEVKQLYQTYYSGIDWVDTLNATVRPVLAYGFFFLYVTVKGCQFAHLLMHAPVGAMWDLLWTEEDQAIFASVISFYYGQRAMHKLSQISR